MFIYFLIFHILDSHARVYCIFRYIGILVELTRIEGTKHGELIANQMLDVAIRVEAVRGAACARMSHLLENTPLLIGQNDSICQVLYAAAYICGEFSQYVGFIRNINFVLSFLL